MYFLTKSAVVIKWNGCNYEKSSRNVPLERNKNRGYFYYRRTVPMKHVNLNSFK
jgi:hypothetical protein